MSILYNAVVLEKLLIRVLIDEGSSTGRSEGGLFLLSSPMATTVTFDSSFISSKATAVGLPSGAARSTWCPACARARASLAAMKTCDGMELVMSSTRRGRVGAVFAAQ